MNSKTGFVVPIATMIALFASTPLAATHQAQAAGVATTAGK
jgi:hypothetical protein